MSLQESPQNPQQETVQQRAARIIQKAWKRHVHREVFKYFKELTSHFNQRDPQTILRAVNPREAELLDAAAGVFIKFRLGGITFPPNIYYKIFTYRPIADVCASSPRDYTQLGLKIPVEDQSGWYRRMENNGWRLFCSKVVSVVEPMEIGGNKKMEFHYSRLRRQQDVDRWRKKRKTEWLKQMYNQGRLQAQPLHPNMEKVVVNSVQEVMEAIEERGDDEVLEVELDDLLTWTSTLNFEDYMQEWRSLACSQSSEPGKG